jgi:type VI secretion system protein ImpL
VLVDEARRIFSRLPMPERVYARLRSTASDAPPWRPADALGPSGQRLFRAAVRPAAGRGRRARAVHGRMGLYRTFLPRLPKAITEAASESWVLGPEAAAAASDPQQLEAAVLGLYAQEYATEWQTLLDSLALAPFGSPANAAEALNVLGAPNSPLRDLMQGIARQLTPSTPPPPTAAAAAASAAGNALQKAAGVTTPASGSAASRIAEAIGVGAAPSNPAAVVAKAVEDRFRPLREASGKPLDGVIAVLNELYVQVAKIATAAPGSAPAPGAVGLDPGQRLQAEAQRAPEPLARWLKSLNQSSTAVRLGGAVSSLAAASGQQLKPFCQNLEARFPFNRSSLAPDMPIGDFGRLFGPNGAMDQFFSQNLRDLVDTSQRVWRPVALPGAPAPVSASDVVQFQRAAAIRNAFFPAGLPGAAPAGTLRFELVPMGSTGASLSVDGGAPVALPAGMQPGRPIVLQWPSSGRIALAL